MVPPAGGEVPPEAFQFLLPVEIVDRNGGAGLRQRQRDGLADALDAAQHESDFADQVHAQEAFPKLNRSLTSEERHDTRYWILDTG